LVNAFEAFPRLLSPLKIGDVVFRNRMFAAPVNSAEIISDGQPSLEAVAYFERRLWAARRRSHTEKPTSTPTIIGKVDILAKSLE
jgi:hypothetical protein